MPANKFFFFLRSLLSQKVFERTLDTYFTATCFSVNQWLEYFKWYKGDKVSSNLFIYLNLSTLIEPKLTKLLVGLNGYQLN